MKSSSDQRVFVVNPPDVSTAVRISKDMAGGFGFNAGTGVVLPPLGLIYHALTLRKHDYSVRFYDLQADRRGVDDFFRQIDKNGSDVFIVLVTLPTLEHDSAFIAGIRSLSHQARILVKFDLKDKKVIHRLLKVTGVEKVLFGETETAVHHIIQNRSTDGTAYLKDKEVVFGADRIVESMDCLPDLDIDFVDLSSYEYVLLPKDNEKAFFTFQSSRGCPFSCAYYCPYPLIQGRTLRMMSSRKLFDNVRLLATGYKATSLLFRDATFTADRQRTIDFCSRIINSRLTIDWWCETRMNCLDDELMTIMARAGCRGMNIGVETGDEALMKDQAKRGGDLKQLTRIRETADRLNIKLHFLMTVGLPDETKTTLYHSYALINRLKPDSLGITTITPYPGTPLYKDAVKENLIINRDFSDYIGNRAVMKTRHLSIRQLKLSRFLLQVSGYLSRRRFIAYRFMNRLFRMGFYIWSRI